MQRIDGLRRARQRPRMIVSGFAPQTHPSVAGEDSPADVVPRPGYFASRLGRIPRLVT